jgi:hypothetical protein
VAADQFKHLGVLLAHHHVDLVNHPVAAGQPAVDVGAGDLTDDGTVVIRESFPSFASAR